jgi:hypothetical protein
MRIYAFHAFKNILKHEPFVMVITFNGDRAQTLIVDIYVCNILGHKRHISSCNDDSVIVNALKYYGRTSHWFLMFLR